MSKRNIHGVVLLDKPVGMSSNQALQKVKRAFGARKAGHTGSLDPLATGLLPVCLGQATKVCEYLLHSHKRYVTEIRLGETTDTYDAEGQVLITRPVTVSNDDVQAALKQFRGDIMQVPPMYSALKDKGVPLYKKARQGEEVERPARPMTVYELSATRIDECHYRLEVHCSSGFYIRSLAYDLGEALGCGAHVTALRRTAIKALDVSQAITLESLQAMSDPLESLLPIDVLLADMPSMQIDDAQAEALLQGRSAICGDESGPELKRFYRPDGTLFAIGNIQAGGALKTHKIFVFDD